MIVSELLEILNTLPGDVRVIVQRDAEGNDYKQIYGAEEAYGEDVEDWRPEFVYSLEDLEEDDDEDPDSYTKVVVIY